jgi:hypothetical protein
MVAGPSPYGKCRTMIIGKPPLPAALKAHIDSQPRATSPEGLVPGFILDIDQVLACNPSLSSGLPKAVRDKRPLRATPRPETALQGTPYVVFSPEQAALIFSSKGTPGSPERAGSIFSFDKELALFKPIVSCIARQVDLRLKLAIDGLWVVYGGAKLWRAFKRPDRDTASLGFKVVGLGADVAQLAGNFFPGLKLDDPWANGINWIAKSGGAICQGKTPPLNEMLLSTQQRAEIPLALFHFVGGALDPRPEFAALRAVPLPAPRK